MLASGYLLIFTAIMNMGLDICLTIGFVSAGTGFGLFTLLCNTAFIALWMSNLMALPITALFGKLYDGRNGLVYQNMEVGDCKKRILNSLFNEVEDWSPSTRETKLYFADVVKEAGSHQKKDGQVCNDGICRLEVLSFLHRWNVVVSQVAQLAESQTETGNQKSERHQQHSEAGDQKPDLLSSQTEIGVEQLDAYKENMVKRLVFEERKNILVNVLPMMLVVGVVIAACFSKKAFLFTVPYFTAWAVFLAGAILMMSYVLLHTIFLFVMMYNILWYTGGTNKWTSPRIVLTALIILWCLISVAGAALLKDGFLIGIAVSNLVLATCILHIFEENCIVLSSVFQTKVDGQWIDSLMELVSCIWSWMCHVICTCRCESCDSFSEGWRQRRDSLCDFMHDCGYIGNVKDYIWFLPSPYGPWFGVESEQRQCCCCRLKSTYSAVTVSVLKQMCYTFSILLAFVVAATFVFGFYSIWASPRVSRTEELQSANLLLNKLGSPVCAFRWGSLDALDFGTFAWVAYGDDENIADVLNQYFLYRHKTNMQDWETTHVSPAGSPVVFYEARSPSNNITVLATRGTVETTDWMENVAVWSESGLLEIISVIIPLTSVLPVDVVSKYVKWASLVEGAHDKGPLYYFRSVEDQLEQSKIRFPNDTFFLAGHSLGGGIAKIVGARQNLPAITLSSPGVLFLKDKFDFTEANLNNNAITISARFDAIPFFGRHGGTYAAVDCTHSALNPGECHDSGRLICAMDNICGLGENSELRGLFQCEQRTVMN